MLSNLIAAALIATGCFHQLPDMNETSSHSNPTSSQASITASDNINQDEELRPSIYTMMLLNSCSNPRELQLKSTVFAQAYLFRSEVIEFSITHADMQISTEMYAASAQEIIESLEQLDGERGYLHPSPLVLADIGGNWIHAFDGGANSAATHIAAAIGIMLITDPSKPKTENEIIPNPVHETATDGFNSVSGFTLVIPSVPSKFSMCEQDELKHIGNDLSELVAEQHLTEDSYQQLASYIVKNYGQ